MDTLLAELKHHSTVLCSSSLDFEDLRPLDKSHSSPSSNSSGFFNFSYLEAIDQPVKKSFDEMVSQAAPTVDFMPIASPQAPLHSNPQDQSRDFWSFGLEDLTPVDSASKEGNSKEDESLTPFSAPQVDGSYDQFFLNFDSQSNTERINNPNCRGSPFGYFGFTQPSKKYLIQDAIEVNKKTIDFGVHLPGKILEETLEITNKTDQALSVEVLVYCVNPELQDSQEYIYSIRSNQAYDYSETRQFIMNANSLTSFKVALKVPAVRLANQVAGKVRILVQNFEGECVMDLTSKAVMPKITCPKQLYSKILKRNFINVAVQKGKSQEKKISLKNDADIPVTLDLGFYKTQAEAENCDFECSVFPKMLTIPAKSTGIVTVLFKASKAAQNKENNSKTGPTQKVLYGKAQDSSLVYSFPLWVETF